MWTIKAKAKWGATARVVKYDGIYRVEVGVGNSILTLGEGPTAKAAYKDACGR